MKNELLTNHMSIKDAFSMHAANEQPFDDQRELIKGVTVRLPVKTRAQLAAFARMIDMTRQDVLEELINGGLSEAFKGYLSNWGDNEDARKKEIADFHALSEEIEGEMRAEEEGK